MAFSDPQTITVNSIAKSLPRISVGTSESTYTTADGAYKLRISHQPTKSRTRRMVRIDQTKIAAGPLTALNSQISASVYIVIDEPKVGFDDTELGYLVSALVAYMTGGNTSKVLGSES